MKRDRDMTNNELSTEIAIKLFGWRWFTGSWLTDKSMACLVSPDVQRTSREEDAFVVDLPAQRTNRVTLDIPLYADSWDGARLVVEAMNARGYETTLCISAVGRACCLFEIGGQPDARRDAYGDTLPVAVCSAALSTFDKHVADAMPTVMPSDP